MIGDTPHPSGIDGARGLSGMAILDPLSRIQNPKSKIQNRDGFTLLEMIIVIAILSVLTAAAIPMVRNTVKREREAELRLYLRQLRQALDAYHLYHLQSNGMAIPIEWRTQTGWPKNLEILADGFIPANVVGTSGAKVRFLRRIPEDPMTGTKDWGLRSYKDEPDTTSWGGEDVFDVFTRSDGTALNGTKYRDW
ncbi:MAG TPA: type II secretion system protein [Blastocatellia bacterium]|nr:type II secretion system protein [Blastocatellia bacterium]